jgi:hypothetical protein
LRTGSGETGPNNTSHQIDPDALHNHSFCSPSCYVYLTATFAQIQILVLK